jgi:hypothetical protein
MTSNRLIERSSAPKAGAGNAEHCPVGYDDPQAWCDWRNSEMARTDIKWIVGSNGTPVLVDREEWSVEHAKREAKRKEEERRRFNWRQEHPVAEPGKAA